MPTHRPLGKTGLAIAPLGLGGHVFGWTVDEATSCAILDRFVDEGFNLIDTADIYGRFWMGVPGLSESIIGRWLKRSGRRSSVLLATKVGGIMGPAQSGLSAKHILASVEGSLQRLGVEQIDLYQSHLDDTAIPLEETLTAYAALLRGQTAKSKKITRYGAGKGKSASSHRHGIGCKVRGRRYLQRRGNSNLSI